MRSGCSTRKVVSNIRLRCLFALTPPPTIKVFESYVSTAEIDFLISTVVTASSKSLEIASTSVSESSYLALRNELLF